MTAADVKRKIRIRKFGGDDQYSWALFINGHPAYSGMTKSEAEARRRRAIRNVTSGKHWDS